MKKLGWSSLIFVFVVFASAITTGCTNASRSQGGQRSGTRDARSCFQWQPVTCLS
jgi:hypothetical protein